MWLVVRGTKHAAGVGRWLGRMFLYAKGLNKNLQKGEKAGTYCRSRSDVMGNACVPLLSPQLAGGIILGVALWLRHDSQTTNILYLQLGDKQAPNTFYVGK